MDRRGGEPLGFVGVVHGTSIRTLKTVAATAPVIRRAAKVGKRSPTSDRQGERRFGGGKGRKVGKSGGGGKRAGSGGEDLQGKRGGAEAEDVQSEGIRTWQGRNTAERRIARKRDATPAATKAGKGTEKPKAVRERRNRPSDSDATSTAAQQDGGFYVDSLRLYLSEIRRYEMLEHSEEVELARKVSTLVKAEKTRDRLQGSLGRMPTFTEWASELKITGAELQQTMLEGTSAKQSLVTANLRLVNSVVNKSSRKSGHKLASFKMQDLMQEGVFGLLRAAEKFDGDKGFRFSTYATYWITTVDRPVRIPSRLYETYSKMKKCHREYLKEHGRSPTEQELADWVGVTKAKLRFCIESVTSSTVSTDLTLQHNFDGSLTLGDMLEGDEDVDERMVESMFRSDLDRTLRKYLNPKERAALRLRFGLDDGGERTLKQIAKVLNISGERTRQIIFEAIMKLRKREVQSALEDYMPDLFRDQQHSTESQAHS